MFCQVFYTMHHSFLEVPIPLLSGKSPGICIFKKQTEKCPTGDGGGREGGGGKRAVQMPPVQLKKKLICSLLGQSPISRLSQYCFSDRSFAFSVLLRLIAFADGVIIKMKRQCCAGLKITKPSNTLGQTNARSPGQKMWKKGH